MKMPFRLNAGTTTMVPRSFLFSNSPTGSVLVRNGKNVPHLLGIMSGSPRSCAPTPIDHTQEHRACQGTEQLVEAPLADHFRRQLTNVVGRGDDEHRARLLLHPRKGATGHASAGAAIAGAPISSPRGWSLSGWSLNAPGSFRTSALLSSNTSLYFDRSCGMPSSSQALATLPTA
jgi:hypothetical protein